MDGHDLDVDVVPAPANLLVLDAQIWEVHLLVEVKQVVFERPLFYLPRVAVGVAVVVVSLTIPLVQPLLIFPLELVVEDDPIDTGVALREAFRFAKVGPADVSVVFELARSLDAGIELLARVAIPLPLGLRIAVAVRLQKVAASRREHHGQVPAAIHPDGVDQFLLAQVPEVARPGIGWPVGMVAEVAGRHNAKRADRGQGSRFGAAKRVFTAAVANDLAFQSAGEVEVFHEHITGIGTTFASITVAFQPACVAPAIAILLVDLGGSGVGARTASQRAVVIVPVGVGSVAGLAATLARIVAPTCIAKHGHLQRFGVVRSRLYMASRAGCILIA